MSGSPSGLIPKTNNSSLGLGAAGGPRGFAAGVTQVLVNFLLNYDGQALKQLAAELQKNNSAQQLNAQRLAAYTKNQKDAEASLAQIQRAKLAISNTNSQTAQQTLKLLQQQTAEQKAYGQATQATAAQLRVNLGHLTQSGTITARDVALLQNEYRIVQAVGTAQRGVADALQRQEALNAENLALERARESVSARAKSGASRIGSLALGLIGGTIGGALVSGALLGPLQDTIDNVVNGLQKMTDPAKGASEALGTVNEQLDDLAKNRNYSSTEAAVDLLKQLKAPVTPQNIGALTSASQLRDAQSFLETQRKSIDYLNGANQLHDQIGRSIVFNSGALQYQNQQLERGGGLTSQFAYPLLQLAQSTGLDQAFNNVAKLAGLPTLDDMLGINSSTIDSAVQESAALYDVQRAAQAAADYISQLNQESVNVAVTASFDSQITAAQNTLAQFKDRVNRETDNTIDRINRTFSALEDGVRAQADQRIKALQNQMSHLEVQPSARTNALQKQLEALKDAEPSRRTKELTDRINDLNEAQSKRQYQQQLSDVNEQISLARLKQRLATTGQEIDLEKYQGEARLVALDALIERQQKANEAQQRFNQLLDIQYKIQTGVRREQGETIRDFIARRAQYYRGLLQQATELRQQGPIADLQAEKERVQQSIELKELEDKKRRLIEDRARQEYLKSLQEQLAASQERDQKELESRRDSLQKQLEASKKADQDALDAKRERLQNEIEAVRENADKQIQQYQNTRDSAIRNAESIRDKSIAAAEYATQKTIDQLRERAEMAEKWTQFSNQQALDQAIKGASSMAQLQSLAGSVAGLEWTMNYLYQTGGLMGMDPAARQQLINNYVQVIRDYQSQFTRFYSNARPPAQRNFGDRGTGLADGGVFVAGNHNTPLNSNIRWGDGQGDELGVMLNNKVMHTLREQGMMNKGFGDITINRSDNPYRDRDLFRREVKAAVREELSKR